MSLGKRPQPGAKRPEPHVPGTPAPDIDGDFVHQASLYSFADQLKDMGGTAISIVPGDAPTYDPLRFCGPTHDADRSTGAPSESVEFMYRSVTTPLVVVEPSVHLMFERFLKPQEPNQ